MNQNNLVWDDSQLTTPQHDKIMFWLDENIESILKTEFAWENQWDPRQIKEGNEVIKWLKDHSGEVISTDIPSHPTISIERKVWEFPIRTKFYDNDGPIVGYADLYVEVGIPKLRFTNQWEIEFRGGIGGAHFIFEVKPKIESVGATIRQIRKYECYAERATLVVVCPDDTFKDKFIEQGIGFVKAETV